MGNDEVIPLNAFECANEFLNDLGYNNMIDYNMVCSNSYSSEYMLEYSMASPEAGDIEKVCVFVEKDGDGELYVTFYVAKYKN